MDSESNNMLDDMVINVRGGALGCCGGSVLGGSSRVFGGHGLSGCIPYGLLIIAVLIAIAYFMGYSLEKKSKEGISNSYKSSNYSDIGSNRMNVVSDTTGHRYKDGNWRTKDFMRGGQRSRLTNRQKRKEPLASHPMKQPFNKRNQLSGFTNKQRERLAEYDNIQQIEDIHKVGFRHHEPTTPDSSLIPY